MQFSNFKKISLASLSDICGSWSVTLLPTAESIVGIIKLSSVVPITLVQDICV